MRPGIGRPYITRLLPAHGTPFSGCKAGGNGWGRSLRVYVHFYEIALVFNTLSNMKYTIALAAAFAFASCVRQRNSAPQLQAQIDSLRHELENMYKPGFGEFMTSIQVHHSRLWFAGINNNWELAEFEVHEIEESIDDLNTYWPERTETSYLETIKQPLASVSDAIHHKNGIEFKGAYMTLTNQTAIVVTRLRNMRTTLSPFQPRHPLVTRVSRLSINDA